MIVAERGRKAKCTNCEWSGPQTDAIDRMDAPATPATAGAS